MSALCVCGHGKSDHSGDRADDFGCEVPGCWASGACSGWSPPRAPKVNSARGEERK